MARFFISYSRADKAIAQQIRDHISLLDSKHYVFLDSKDITTGEDWQQRLRFEIENADFVILILSSASLASDWVEKETEWATSAESKSGVKKLFVYRIDDAEIPEFLTSRQIQMSTGNFTIDFFRLMEGILQRHSFFTVKHSLELEDRFYYTGTIWIEAHKKFLDLIYMAEYRFDYSFWDKEPENPDDRGTISGKIETIEIDTPEKYTAAIQTKFAMPFRTSQHFTAFVMLYLKNTKELSFVHPVYLTNA
ncbi:MAG: toll/interleukin-1 receptor domain-containing protein [Chitinophagaceae bacterium]|nr:toll/interleukin-1 receptor domain-containing protein [Chitinophagaceae bacterium]